jgi:uncharacterized protein
MKITWIILFLIVASFAGYAQRNNDNIELGKKVTIFSKILDEKRILWIYLPGDYNQIADKSYPVAYLLDGSTNFTAFTAIVQHLSEMFRNKLVPQMIVVGILNTDRRRDLTPTASLTDENGNVTKLKGPTGGGEKFVSFIQYELFHYIDSAYRTSDFKMLIGHSLGGLTVINCLINHSNLFNAYIAIDPSMWWDSKKLLMQAEDTLKQNKFSNKYLFLAIANTMQTGMDTLHVKTDTAKQTIHIRSIFKLKDELMRYPQNGLVWNYKYYNDDSHGTVPLIAEYDAVRFIFSRYEFLESK